MQQLEMEERVDEVVCPSHGLRRVKNYKLFADWGKAECDLCASEQRAADEKAAEAARQVEEKSRRDRAIRSKLARSAIPSRFDGRRLNDYVGETPRAAGALATCREYAEGFPDRLRRGASLILCGNAGTGKTHLACGIAQHVIHTFEKSAAYITVGRAFRAVKDTYRRDSKTSEAEALAIFSAPDLLILDEVGVQYGSDTERNILFEIVNDR